jgi:hypothetical protein
VRQRIADPHDRPIGLFGRCHNKKLYAVSAKFGSQPQSSSVPCFQIALRQVLDYVQTTMASLPPALDFSKMEEAICEKWDKEGAFQAQDRLAQERGDEVRVCVALSLSRMLRHCVAVSELNGTGPRLFRSFPHCVPPH